MKALATNLTKREGSLNCQSEIGQFLIKEGEKHILASKRLPLARSLVFNRFQMDGEVFAKIVPTIKLKLDSPPWRRQQLRIDSHLFTKRTHRQIFNQILRDFVFTTW